MNEGREFENWRISLATRNNLLYNDIPYIPILVEDIPIYLSLDDHEENGVKTIQTLGELISETETHATLLSLTPGNNSKFPVNFKNLHINDIYIKNSDDTYCTIWKKYQAFKVYGTLNVEEMKNVLEVSHLVPIHDIIGTCNVMSLTIAIARSENRQYYRTTGQNNMLQLQWDKMKKEKKRLTKENTL